MRGVPNGLSCTVGARLRNAKVLARGLKPRLEKCQAPGAVGVMYVSVVAKEPFGPKIACHLWTSSPREKRKEMAMLLRPERSNTSQSACAVFLSSARGMQPSMVMDASVLSRATM